MVVRSFFQLDGLLLFCIIIGLHSASSTIMILIFDLVVILKGKVRSWSLYLLKG